jgi:hypothetical protein
LPSSPEIPPADRAGEFYGLFIPFQYTGFMKILKALTVDDLIGYLEIIHAYDARVAEGTLPEVSPLLLGDGLPDGWWLWVPEAVLDGGLNGVFEAILGAFVVLDGWCRPVKSLSLLLNSLGGDVADDLYIGACFRLWNLSLFLPTLFGGRLNKNETVTVATLFLTFSSAVLNFVALNVFIILCQYLAENGLVIVFFLHFYQLSQWLLLSRVSGVLLDEVVRQAGLL